MLFFGSKSTRPACQLSAAAAGLALSLYSGEVNAQQDALSPSLLEEYGITAEELDEVEFPLPGEVEEPDEGEREEPEQQQPQQEGCEWENPECEEEGSAGLDSSEAEALQSYLEYQLVRIGNWPETKTEFEHRCVKIFGKRICSSWPVIYTRTSTLWLLARVYYPDAADAEQVARTCINIAAVTGVISLISTMETNVAAATLLLTLRECAQRELGNLAQRFDLELKHRIEPGEWRRV